MYITNVYNKNTKKFFVFCCFLLARYHPLHKLLLYETWRQINLARCLQLHGQAVYVVPLNGVSTHGATLVGLVI